MEIAIKFPDFPGMFPFPAEWPPCTKWINLGYLPEFATEHIGNVSQQCGYTGTKFSQTIQLTSYSWEKLIHSFQSSSATNTTTTEIDGKPPTQSFRIHGRTPTRKQENPNNNNSQLCCSTMWSEVDFGVKEGLRIMDRFDEYWRYSGQYKTAWSNRVVCFSFDMFLGWRRELSWKHLMWLFCEECFDLTHTILKLEFDWFSYHYLDWMRVTKDA